MRARRPRRGKGRILIAFLVSAAIAAPLAGRYELRLVTATRARAPVLGWLDSETVTILLVDLEERSGGVWQRQRTCEVRIESEGPAKVSFPAAFVRAFPEKELPVALAPTEDGRTAFRVDMGVDALGFDPAHTGGDLPRRATDSGVVDSDRDGRPGVTIDLAVPILGRVELYVAQRGSMRLDGWLVEEGGAEGTIELGPIEQVTLGTSTGIDLASPRIVPVEGRFALTPVAPTTDCDDLLLARSETRCPCSCCPLPWRAPLPPMPTTPA